MRHYRGPRSEIKTKILLAACALILLASILSSRIYLQPVGVYGQSQPAFGGSIDLSQAGANASNPDIWNSGSYVYVVWAQNTSGLEFRMSPDGGATWYPSLSSPPLNLAQHGGYSSAPLLSANGSNVYVVWPEVVNGSAQIMEATSTDYGQSFNWTIQLTYGNSSNITPVIASWGDNVYVAWTAGTYSFVSCSNDSGAPGTWTIPYNYGTQHEPEIAAWGGQYVYAVSDAGLAVSSNNCQSWQSESLHPWGSEPWIWAYGPNAYAAWEAKGNSSVVYYSYSNSYGANWTQPAVLSSAFNDTWAPMVWAYNNSAWIAVHTYPGGPKSVVYMYTTSDAGANWSSPVQLSQGPRIGSDTSFPFTVTSSDGQNVFVAWSQQTDANTWQVYASYSPDAGLNWTAAPGIDVSQNPNGTQASNNNDLANAAIASYGSNCYAIWQYMVGNTNQIYFASTQFNPPPSTSTTTSPLTTTAGNTSQSSTIVTSSPTTTHSNSESETIVSTSAMSSAKSSSILTSQSRVVTLSSSSASESTASTSAINSATTSSSVAVSGSKAFASIDPNLALFTVVGVIGTVSLGLFGMTRRSGTKRAESLN
jgi:hypothetical protein